MTDSEKVAAIAEISNILRQSKTHDDRCEANEYGICACANNEIVLRDLAVQRVGELTNTLTRDAPTE